MKKYIITILAIMTCLACADDSVIIKHIGTEEIADYVIPLDMLVINHDSIEDLRVGDGVTPGGIRIQNSMALSNIAYNYYNDTYYNGHNLRLSDNCRMVADDTTYHLYVADNLLFTVYGESTSSLGRITSTSYNMDEQQLEVYVSIPGNETEPTISYRATLLEEWVTATNALYAWPPATDPFLITLSDTNESGYYKITFDSVATGRVMSVNAEMFVSKLQTPQITLYDTTDAYIRAKSPAGDYGSIVVPPITNTHPGTLSRLLSDDETTSYWDTGEVVRVETDPAFSAAYASGLDLSTMTNANFVPNPTNTWISDYVLYSDDNGTTTYADSVIRTETDPIFTNSYALGLDASTFTNIPSTWTNAVGGIGSITNILGGSNITIQAGSGPEVTIDADLSGYSESDPIWTAATDQYYTIIGSDAVYATGTPLYVYTETDPIWVNDKTNGFTVDGPVTNVGSLTVTNSSDVNLNVLSSSGNAFMTFESQAVAGNAQITMKAANGRSTGFDFWEAGARRWLFSTDGAADDLVYYWWTGSWTAKWRLDESGSVTMTGSLDMGGQTITNVGSVVIENTWTGSFLADGTNYYVTNGIICTHD